MPLSPPPEPEEKQKEILNNSIPERKDSGDLTVFTLHSGFDARAQSVQGSGGADAANCLWSTAKYVGGYHGLLSGVTVRPGSVEPHSVVECLYACREGLDFGDLETLGSGMKVTPPSEPRADGAVLRGAPLTLWQDCAFHHCGPTV